MQSSLSLEHECNGNLYFRDTIVKRVTKVVTPVKFAEEHVNLVIELLRRATIKSLSADMLVDEMTKEKNLSKARE